MYGEYLTWRGIEVREVGSAVAAIRELSRALPDAVVTEDRLPDSTGPELVRVLRRSRYTSNVPIVLLCSDTFAIRPDEAERYGCDRILVVPLLPEALHDVLRVVAYERASARRTPPFESRLFTRQGQSVWMVRTAGQELAVAGPGRERGVFAFERERDLLSFQAEYEQRLARTGFMLQATGDDRRNGRERRQGQRAGLTDRRSAQ